MKSILFDHIEEVKKMCKTYQVKSLYVFGSVCTEAFTERSDIDFLLVFEPDISVKEYTDNYFTLLYNLQEIFGRKVDLITNRSLSNPYFIQSIEKTKEIVYESGN